VNLQGLMEKVGIGAEAIKSGENKDLGLPTKPLSPEDREIFQKMINNMYDRFLEVVQQGRQGLAADRIRTLADGRIYTAKEAMEVGLIDQIGYLEQAIDIAKSEAGLKEARVILYGFSSLSKRGEPPLNLGNRSQAAPAGGIGEASLSLDAVSG
jgi:protease IV